MFGDELGREEVGPEFVAFAKGNLQVDPEVSVSQHGRLLLTSIMDLRLSLVAELLEVVEGVSDGEQGKAKHL